MLFRSYGGVIDKEIGRRVMKCKLFDYTEPMKHQLFFNSPFFDGVRDHNAVDEILSFAGSSLKSRTTLEGSSASSPIQTKTIILPLEQMVALLCLDGTLCRVPTPNLSSLSLNTKTVQVFMMAL